MICEGNAKIAKFLAFFGENGKIVENGDKLPCTSRFVHENSFEISCKCRTENTVASRLLTG